MRFWVFECSFVANNNLLMGEVFVGATRKELLAAMAAFFRAPRAQILAANVLGAWSVEDGSATTYHAAAPFLTVTIAKRELPFAEAADLLVGDLESGIPRAYLAKGRAYASDAKESDEEDDEDPELKPFKLELDAKGFLASLPELDGEPLSPAGTVKVVRPVAAPGFSVHDDHAYYHPDVDLTPGWSDAAVDSTPRRFDPKSRFKRNLELPRV